MKKAAGPKGRHSHVSNANQRQNRSFSEAHQVLNELYSTKFTTEVFRDLHKVVSALCPQVGAIGRPPFQEEGESVNQLLDTFILPLGEFRYLRLFTTEGLVVRSFDRDSIAELIGRQEKKLLLAITVNDTCQRILLDPLSNETGFSGVPGSRLRFKWDVKKPDYLERFEAFGDFCESRDREVRQHEKRLRALESSLLFLDRFAAKRGGGEHVIHQVYSGCFSHVLFLARSMLLCLQEFFPDKLELMTHASCMAWMKGLFKYSETQFVDIAKYVTVYPMARFLRNPEPKAPVIEGKVWSDPYLWIGPLRTILRNRVASYCARNEYLMHTYLQGIKRACSMVSESFIGNAIVSHVRGMRNDPLPVPDWLRTRNFRFLRIPIKPNGRGGQMGWVDFGQPGCISKTIIDPSTRATYDFAAKVGGGYEEVYRSIARSRGLDICNIQDFPLPLDVRGIITDSNPDWIQESQDTATLDQLRSFHANQVTCTKEFGIIRRFIQKCEDLFHFGEPQSQHDDLKGTQGNIIFSDVTEKEILHVIKEERLLANSSLGSFQDPLCCKVIPLCEYLKVRTITTCPGLYTTLGHNVQREMADCLKTYPCFALIGQSLDLSHLYHLDRLTEDILVGTGKKFNLWNSGDYKSATDLISIDITLAVFDIMSSKLKLDPELHYEVRKLLEPVDLLYPKKYSEDIFRAFGEKVEVIDEEGVPRRCYKLPDGMWEDAGAIRVRQRSGQLMGSILSFPILCLINLMCYWEAIEEYLGKSIRLEDLPVLINGDDILFRSNDELTAIWKIRISEVGFQLSVGKNYIHPTTFTINSRCFRYNPTAPHAWRFQETGYLNCGLIVNQSKGKDSLDRDLPVWAFYEEAFRLALNKEYLTSIYMVHNWTTLGYLTEGFKLNPFLPRCVGGLGMQLCPKLRALLHSHHALYTAEQMLTHQYMYGRYNKHRRSGYVYESDLVQISYSSCQKMRRAVPSKFGIPLHQQRMLIIEQKYFGPHYRHTSRSCPTINFSLPGYYPRPAGDVTTGSYELLSHKERDIFEKKCSSFKVRSFAELELVNFRLEYLLSELPDLKDVSNDTPPTTHPTYESGFYCFPDLFV